MATIIFIPNDHMVAWVYHAPRMSPAHVVSNVGLGVWPFPLRWRGALDEQFIVPEEGLRLRALAQGDLVVVRASVPLKERVRGRFIPFNARQVQVLHLMSLGFTTGQMARATHMRRRWVKYRVAEVKRRLGAATREEAVALGECAEAVALGKCAEAVALGKCAEAVALGECAEAVALGKCAGAVARQMMVT